MRKGKKPQRGEVLEFFAEVMRGDDASATLRERLKAAELLDKALDTRACRLEVTLPRIIDDLPRSGGKKG